MTAITRLRYADVVNILYYCNGAEHSVLQSFQQRLPEACIFDWRTEADKFDPSTIEAAIVWMPPANFFDELSALTHVFAFSAGVDQLLQHPGLHEDVVVVRLRDAGMADQMAEYVLYGVLYAQRQMGKLHRQQQRGEWCRNVQAITADRLPVGVLGAGAIGLQVALRLSRNGYPVSCWSRTPHPSVPDQVQMFTGSDGLSSLLSRSRVLVCLLPLTHTTSGILNSELFSQLPDEAFLINPGRGDHLVERDLLDALDSGQLAGALLDVFGTEPLPPGHAFWSHPNILVTPHIAAQSLEAESVDQIVDAIRCVQRGENPRGTVDRTRGY